METIESLRVEVLEHHTEALIHRAHLIERRLRWWRALACGLLMLGLVSLPLPSSTAQEDYSGQGLPRRLAALEYKLAHVTGGANEVVITGANLRIVNGLGATDTVNGLGNLIVGYNESRDDGTDNRTGSHNIIVGMQNSFSSFGGLVVGRRNEISGDFSSVSGGTRNTASGFSSSISGGSSNVASHPVASVSGGQLNIASGQFASVSGGNRNTAEGVFASVSGGTDNTASGLSSSVTGGVANTASGVFSSVSGRDENTASGDRSSVSGGSNRSAPGEFNWAAGPLFANN